MAYDGVIEDIRKCANLTRPGQIPVFGLSEEFDVKWYGATYADYCQDARVMAECQIAAVQEFDYDWAWLQVDDCIEFEPLGVGTRWDTNILRATCEYLPPTFETLKKLRVPDPYKDGRMPVLLDAIHRVRERFGNTVCVTGRTAAPFSSVGLLYSLQELMLLPYTNAELFQETLEFFVELQTRFGLAQIEAGAHALWFGDCNASSHLVSPEIYRKWAFEPAKRVTEAYKKAGGFVFYHASEEGKSLEAMTQLGVTALSPGPGINIRDALSIAQGKGCIIGNLDPINVLMNGTAEDVRRETTRIMEAGKQTTGFMFDSGEMIPRDTPEENIRTMVKTARELSRW
jgi:uroporphyrinogen decarboxylase